MKFATLHEYAVEAAHSFRMLKHWPDSVICKMHGQSHVNVVKVSVLSLNYFIDFMGADQCLFIPSSISSQFTYQDLE